MMTHRHPSTALIIYLLVTFSSALLLAQTSSTASPHQEPASGIPLFKEKVRRVLVDVVVRDSDGRPLHGLSARDFSVGEDRKVQHVLSFEEYKLDSPSISLPPSSPALPRDTFINVPATPQRGPLYVVLYDMVNMEQEDQITARQQVLKFIQNKPAGTRFAIFVNSDGLHLIQGFTDSKERLFSVLDPHSAAPHLPMSFLMSRNYGQGDAISAMQVLTYIGTFLNGLPGRKNLLWLSGRFPVSLYPRDGDPQDLRDDMRRELDALTRGQVAVYPVNVRGVVTNPEGALTGITPFSGANSVESVQQTSSGGGTQGTNAPAASGTAPGGAPDRSTAAGRTANGLQASGASSSLAEGYMVENDLATATGGQAFHSNNDLKSALSEAVEGGANYYSLSYSPSNPNYNGSLRQIRVTLQRPGYHLAYRRSYYADDPEAPIPAKRTEKQGEQEGVPNVDTTNARERPLYAGLAYGAPLLSDLIFKVRIRAEGLPSPASPEQLVHLAKQPAYVRPKHGAASEKLRKGLQVQRYALYYLISAQQIKVGTNKPLPLEFAAVAFNSEGAALNGVFETASEDTSSDSPSHPKNNVFRAMQELDVPVGATSIRVAVRDILTDRVGALEIPLPIPPEVQSSSSIQSPAEAKQVNQR
jgi:VWFA-related protein